MATGGAIPPPDCPDPADWVDEGWAEEDRLEIAAYLRSGTVPWVGAGFSTCRLCGQPNGSAEYTDGTFIWPEGLAHYVEDHRVRLPDEVMAHIRRRWDLLLDQEDVDDTWWREATSPP